MGKPKPSAYVFYMLEQKRLVPGWKNKSNQELVGLCDKGWTSLSPKEKKKYEDMKEEAKSRDMGTGNQGRERRKGEVRIEGGYDSLGNPLADIRRRDQERAREVRDKVDSVATMVENGSLAGTLETTTFNIIESSVFVKIDEDKVYVPAEISIAKFSLREGVVEVYQAFPRAGAIPLGYKRECLESSNHGHKIPLEDMAVMDADVSNNNKTVEFQPKSDGQIAKDIVAHLAGTDAVFCMPEKMAQCEGVLHTIINRSSLRMPVIKFLPLPELLYKLANSSKEGEMIPSAGIAESELNSERFLYKSGLSCHWHEVMTETDACTSAAATKLCYTVLDLCCQHYKIPLISGKHVPRTVEVDPVGKEWAIPEVKTRVFRNSVVRKPGEFASEDVRLRNNDTKEKELEGIGGVGVSSENEMKATIVKNLLPQGTISDYMGELTESVSKLSVSVCSSDTDFVTMGSLSDVLDPKPQIQPPVVVKGIGRGAVLPGRRMSRIAANFQDVDNCN